MSGRSEQNEMEKPGRIEAHLGLVLQGLQGKPLHEFSMREVMLAAKQALERHPDYEIARGQRGEPVLRQRPQGISNYSHYELPFRIIREMVFSALKEKGMLPQDVRAKSVFERIYRKKESLEDYAEIEDRMAALEEMKALAGEEKLEKMLEAASEVHEKISKEAHEHWKVAKEFEDSFLNPATHPQLRIVNNRLPSQTAYQAYRSALEMRQKQTRGT